MCTRNYSYLSDIAGSSLAAFLAGHIPKNKPTIAEKVIEPIIALIGMAKAIPERMQLNIK